MMESVIKEIVNAAVGSRDRQQLFYCQPTQLIDTPKSVGLKISITNSDLSSANCHRSYVIVQFCKRKQLFIEPVWYLLCCLPEMLRQRKCLLPVMQHHQDATFDEFTVICIFQTSAKIIVILHSARV